MKNSLRMLYYLPQSYKVRNCYNLLLLSRLQGLPCKYHVYFYISLHFRRDIVVTQTRICARLHGLHATNRIIVTFSTVTCAKCEW